MISKSHDSSTHPVTRNSKIMLQLKLWTLLVPLHSYQSWKCLSSPSIAHHQSPAQELRLLAQQHSFPGFTQDPQRLGPAEPPDPAPQQCPAPSSVVLDTEPCPRSWGAQPQRPHRSPGPGGGSPVCASSPPPRCCASSSRAPVPAHLLPVGQAPRPSAAVSSSRPPRPAALPPPRAPRCLPSWGRSAPGAPALRSRAPRPCPLPRYPPALLSSGGSAAARPPTPCRARSGLAPRAWRATLKRHDHRAPIARPRSSHHTPHRAARPRRGEGVGETRAGQGGREGGRASWAGGAAARTEHRAPAPHSAGAAPAPSRAAGGRGLAGGPGTCQGPLAKGAGPVVSPGAGPRKPSRCGGLGRPHPRLVRQASPHSPTPLLPPTIPYPCSPVIATGPSPNAS